MLFKLVATAFFKLLKELWRPRGSLHLVAVIKKGMRIGRLRALESLLDVLQVVGHSLFVEVVDDKSFAARRSTLHLHHTIFDV